MNKKYVLEKLAMDLVRTDEQIIAQQNPMSEALIYGGAAAAGYSIGSIIMKRPVGLAGVLGAAIPVGALLYATTNMENKKRLEDPARFLETEKSRGLYKILKGYEQ